MRHIVDDQADGVEMAGNKLNSHERKDSLFAGMTPTQKNRYRTYLADPQTGASCEMQSAREAIENYWNLEGGRTDEDRDELMSELDCIDDSLEELRDDYGWDGYDDAIAEISDLARSVGLYWPQWRDLKDIEPWEVVGPDAVAVPPKISKKRKVKKMAKKKEAERRNVWVYQPAMPLENTPIEIRVTEPGSDKKLLGRLYVSKGGVTWCSRKQRFNNKAGWSWEKIAELLGE